MFGKQPILMIFAWFGKKCWFDLEMEAGFRSVKVHQPNHQDDDGHRRVYYTRNGVSTIAVHCHSTHYTALAFQQHATNTIRFLVAKTVCHRLRRGRDTKEEWTVQHSFSQRNAGARMASDCGLPLATVPAPLSTGEPFQCDPCHCHSWCNSLWLGSR